MADLKRAQSGVWFGYEFVPAGTVVPASHRYASHPAFVDYDVSEAVASAPVPAPASVPEPEPETGPERPPASGAGSGRDAWIAYAESVGVEVTDDMTRDDIIYAVDEA